MFLSSLNVRAYKNSLLLLLLLLLRYATQKVQKSSWVEPYSSSPSQNCHVVIWHCTAESKRRVAEIKRWFLCRRPTAQKACATEFRKENEIRRINWTQWLNGNWLECVIRLDVWIFRRLTSGCLFCCRTCSRRGSLIGSARIVPIRWTFFGTQYRQSYEK